MKRYISDCGKPVYKDVTEDSPFSVVLFHKPKYQGIEEDGDEAFALHTNIGSLTVVNRLTGFGWRDVESGYRDKEGKFWLACGYHNVMHSGCATIGEAIQWVKDRSNTCQGA